MAGVNVFAADTDAQAIRLFTSAQQQFTNLVRGKPGRLPPPIDNVQSYWTLEEETHVSAMLVYSFVGSRETIRSGLNHFIKLSRVDELMVVSAIYDQAARLRSYEILADVFDEDF